ncbi:MAG: TatD family hydrolase [Deltaproteobacteria bacterium]|nr:TatD family hydrolase [Deltaproteobacteria bacterium]
MDLIDAHLHAESLSWANLREMSMNGIRAAVSFTVSPWRAGADTNTQIALINRLLRHETWRWEENNMQLFVGIGVIAVSVPRDVEKFFLQMEKFLKEPKVVAIGEIGFDPRSQTCKDLKKQEEILKIQLKMAKARNLPVVVHTPPDLGQVKLDVKEKYHKRDFMERSVQLIQDAGLSPETVVLDHLDSEEWIRFALDHGCTAGITIQEWRDIGPDKAANWADEFGPERILLNTDTSTLPSDHLGVPKAVFEMRKRKVSEMKIKKMVYENPVDFYRLSP